MPTLDHQKAQNIPDQHQPQDFDSSFNEDELKAILKTKSHLFTTPTIPTITNNNNSTDGCGDDIYMSLKYLFKLLKFYKLEHYMSDLIDYGYLTAMSLNELKQNDFNNLNVSAYDLKKFLKLQAFIKQVMHTLKVNSHTTAQQKIIVQQKSVVLDHQPMWEMKPKNFQVTNHKTSNCVVSQKSRSKSVDANVAEAYDHQQQHPNSVHHPLTQQTKQQKFKNQLFGPKLLANKQIHFVEMKAYNYGVPKSVQEQQAKKPASQRGFLTSRQTSTKTITHSNFDSESSNNFEMADIYVFARKRPKLACEMKFNDVVFVENQNTMILNEMKHAVDGTEILKQNEFKFDRIFDSTLSNMEIFQENILPFIDDVNKRVDFNCICFGQTGSGKTHTLFGSKNTDGVCLMTVEHLFSQNEKLLCGFYEIYNGQLYDLFNQNSRLVLREDSFGLVNVVGLVETPVKSLTQLRKAIETGQSNRHVGCTSFNKASSRSHAVLQIRLQSNIVQSGSTTRAKSYTHLVNTNNSNKKKTRGFQVLFIDLAGSERGIDAQNNQKDNRKEGAEINQSLLALKECIRCIDQSQTHAPFRQSKLTRVLRDCFIGNGRTVLVATVSPTDDCVQYSLNTLQYANRVRQMTLRSKKKHDNHIFKMKKSVDLEPEILSASSRKFLAKQQQQLHDYQSKRSISQNDIFSVATATPPMPTNVKQTPQRKQAVQKSQPVLLEFENSKFKLLGLNDNDDESKSSIQQETGLKVMTDREIGLFNNNNNNQIDGKKVGSLFHPSRIGMSSTPVHTNQSERNTSSLDESFFENDAPIKGYKVKNDNIIVEKHYSFSARVEKGSRTPSDQQYVNHNSEFKYLNLMNRDHAHDRMLHGDDDTSELNKSIDGLDDHLLETEHVERQIQLEREEDDDNDEFNVKPSLGKFNFNSKSTHTLNSIEAVYQPTTSRLYSSSSTVIPKQAASEETTPAPKSKIYTDLSAKLKSLELSQYTSRSTSQYEFSGVNGGGAGGMFSQTSQLFLNDETSNGGPVQLNKYLQNLERKLAHLRVEMKDTTMMSQSNVGVEQQTPEREQRQQDLNDSINSLNDSSHYHYSAIKKQQQPVESNTNKNCIKLINPLEQKFMSPNLSPASTFVESRDNSSDSPSSNALKVSLHQGVDNLFDKVKAVQANLTGSGVSLTSARDSKSESNSLKTSLGNHDSPLLSNRSGKTDVELKHPIPVKYTNMKHHDGLRSDSQQSLKSDVDDVHANDYQHNKRTINNNYTPDSNSLIWKYPNGCDKTSNYCRSNTLNINEQKPENKSSLNRTKSLLIVAHENQLSDITETCKEEMNLLTCLKDSQMDFDEYINRVDEILTRKALSIRDLQFQINQLKHFNNSNSIYVNMH